MDTNRHEQNVRFVISSRNCNYAASLRIELRDVSTPLDMALIRVHSWLKRKAQHFDRGGDLDVLVADDEIQRAGG